MNKDEVVGCYPLGAMIRYGENKHRRTNEPQDVTHCTDCGCKLRSNNYAGVCAPCERKARP